MNVASCRMSLLTMGLVLMLCASITFASSDTYPEHEVKAAFLYNFMKFTDWPDEKTRDTNNTMTILVIGDYPECKTFKDIQSKNSESGSVRVRIFKSYEQINDPNVLKQSHVLFICKSEKKNIDKILDIVKENHVLTVGEDKKFLESGGMVNFVKYDEKIRFEVNIPAASKADLKIRSKLLKLAKRVITEDTES